MAWIHIVDEDEASGELKAAASFGVLMTSPRTQIGLWPNSSISCWRDEHVQAAIAGF